MKNKFKKITAFFLSFMLFTMISGLYVSVKADNENTVLIGYFSEPGMMNGTEEGAEKSGYVYECMQEIAARTGWRYKYVYGNYSDLYEQLKKGQIDILPYISETDERRKQMLFPDSGMIDETFYLASKKNIVLSEDFHELNGKKIGSTKGYFQNEVLEAFIADHGLDCSWKYYKYSTEKWEGLESGEVDFSVESSLVMQPIELCPVCKIGEKYPVYSAISLKRTDLLEQFNTAMYEINSVNPSFLSGLRVKYFKSIPLFKDLSDKDKLWLDEHKVLRIGAFNNDAPLIYIDDDGIVKGVMPDYVKLMFSSYGVDIPIEWKFYNSNDEALEALRSKEIDVIHPYYPSYNIAESQGVIISSVVYRSPMGLLYVDNYTRSTMKRVATPDTRLGAHYVRENYPASKIVPCKNGYDCIDKMLAGEADSVVLNSTALKKIAGTYNKNFNLKILHTMCNTCFAALPENTAVIDIIDRAAPFLQDTDMNSIEATYYVESDTDVTLRKFFLLHPEYQVVIIAFILIVTAILVVTFIKRRTELAQRSILEEARNAADAANRAKSSFLSNMSHDIRTPMNAILGYTDIALRHSDDSTLTRESLQKIKASGRHLLSLINDILEMSRIESGKLEIAEEPMDIREAVYNVEHMGKSLAVPKSINFEVNTGEIRDPYILADELHLNEVLINIISNAIKYSKEDGTVYFNINQTDDAEDGKVRYRFEIADNGIGMSEEFLEHIFESFSREKTSTISKLEGTGLGMSIVKRIVDLAEGNIDIKSKPGEGTIVSVEFPFRIMDKESAERFRKDKKNIDTMSFDYSLEGKRVLLVEDNEMNREIAEEILKDAGMSVELAEDGDVSVEILKEKGAGYYDFILMDIQMPVMDGYEATKEIRKLPDGDKIPIIAVSANAFKEDKQKSLDAGMNDHIAKPIDIKMLMEAMHRMTK